MVTIDTQKITHSAEETEKLGARISEALLSDSSLPRFIALYGDLGVGKTAFVRGVTGVIAPNAAVRSPTFTLVNEYRSEKGRIFHFDMYRIQSEDDLYSIGFYDYLDNGICLTEWTENIEFALPERYIKVSIKKNDINDPNSRRIEIKLTEN